MNSSRSGLLIENGLIAYYPRKDLGRFRYQPAFKHAFEDIKVIGVNPRLILDDEELFITLVDGASTGYHIPIIEFSAEAREALQDRFEIDLLVGSHLTWEDYTKNRNRVLFPPALVGKPLLVPRFSIKSIILTVKKIIFLRNMAEGILHEGVRNYLDTI